MTNMNRPTDDRENALRAAEAHSAASRDLEMFLRRVPETPQPADIAEYANLLAREESLRAQRQDAVDAMGLQVQSLGSE